MKRKIVIVIAGLSLIFIMYLSSCGTARRSLAVMGPMNITNPDIKRGKVAFMTYCNKCHPGGRAGLAPAINNKPLPGFAIRFQVRHGLGVMPAFKKEVIDQEELDNIIAYLKALKKHNAKGPAEAAILK